MFLFSLLKVTVWNSSSSVGCHHSCFGILRDISAFLAGWEGADHQHAEASSSCRQQLCDQCEASSLGRQRLRFQQSLDQ